ncbi:tRNA (guanosine(46)-N7)-methyltransferase TrmB [Oribacterium sp. WCC10]|uniref:tRNA (guanosine(46)-N7)-methyltransferase TrmB n=1 Tax=Oribacterium sp. WCC10 TaxID=1855343 RepID=UPI0008E109CA|nr:tRNA (guanosine(46)-N7)-methyltransferase TrmB [Oribacterium sp. WCC10]SFG33571.1 tRNA (guanine-N7-)-methyltransferase [Oribacterium sp. WCC10]
MRLRHITGSEDFVANSDYVTHDPENNKGRWTAFFGNDNPIRIEIGMGKGQFIENMAARNPDINYIGIERYDTVILKAIKKREAMEKDGVKLDNLTFISIDARLLADVFAPGEVDRIYLNFSDPWPKDRQANRRLTSPVFMKIYREFLKADGQLEFKTDNTGLFDYSLESIPESGWKLSAVTRDLHNDFSMNEGNIMTEYEEKFSAKGNPIYKLIAVQ